MFLMHVLYQLREIHLIRLIIKREGQRNVIYYQLWDCEKYIVALAVDIF